MSLSLAFRAFFAAFGRNEKAQKIADILNGVVPVGKPEAPDEAKVSQPKSAGRSEALTLLAAFQREARFLDFLQEDLSAYDDAQVGAASRNVHRQCREVVTRMFAPAPLLDGEEGQRVTLPETISPAACNLTGNVSTGSPPKAGTLIHHGWKAGQCEVPQWDGLPQDKCIVAPAEVEV